MGGTALIVGGDSGLGGSLAPHLESAGWKVTRTTRRPCDTGGPRLHLDLAQTGLPAWTKAARFDVAVLCAGETRLAQCRAQPGLTSQVNVAATASLMRALAASGTFVVFLSTSLVFDGRSPSPGEGAPVSPATEYGRQKAAAEVCASGLGGSAAVVRMTKVLNGRTGLAGDWLAALDAGRPVNAYYDVPVAPLSLDETVRGLARVADLRAAGIWHFSPPDELSFHAAARALADARGRGHDQVLATAAGNQLPPPENAPRYAALGTAATERALGLAFRPSREVLVHLASAS